MASITIDIYVQETLNSASTFIKMQRKTRQKPHTHKNPDLFSQIHWIATLQLLKKITVCFETRRGLPRGLANGLLGKGLLARVRLRAGGAYTRLVPKK